MTGRHRNRALAAERRRHAVEMALTGYTYQAIADQLGYASRGRVHWLVTKALKAPQIDSVDELRQLELERLDVLQRAHWAKAREGGDRDDDEQLDPGPSSSASFRAT